MGTLTMSRTALPELDLARIKRFCDERVAVHLRDKIRIKMEVQGRAVTMECRPPWTPVIGPEWTRLPVARLRHVAARGEWELFWCDRNLRWHRYDLIKPSRHVEALLAEIDADPTSIFWG